MNPHLECISVVNNPQVLKTNLLASEPIVSGRLPFTQVASRFSIGDAVARITHSNPNTAYVLSHQDVLLPKNWDRQVLREIANLPGDWGVAGVFGMDARGIPHGHAWSTGLNRVIGTAHSPEECASLDEVLLIVRGGIGLWFDNQMPGYHLYGTDICLAAREIGRRAYSIDAPIIHNSIAVGSLDRSFRDAARYLKKKWPGALPIRTCVTTIDRHLLGIRILNAKRRLKGKHRLQGIRHAYPQRLAFELGFDDYKGVYEQSKDTILSARSKRSHKS